MPPGWNEQCIREMINRQDWCGIQLFTGFGGVLDVSNWSTATAEEILRDIQMTAHIMQHGALPSDEEDEGNHSTMWSMPTHGKSGMYVDAVQLGCDPTGTVDSSALMQECMNELSAAGGGSFHIPSGVYKLEHSISVPQGVHFTAQSAHFDFQTVFHGLSLPVLDPKALVSVVDCSM